MENRELKRIPVQQKRQMSLSGWVVCAVLILLASLVYMVISRPMQMSLGSRSSSSHPHGRYIDRVGFSLPSSAFDRTRTWILRNGILEATVMAMDITATALEPTFQVEEATVSAAMLAEQLTAIAPMPICPPLGTPDPNSPPSPLPPMGPATATCYLSPASIYSISPSRMHFYMTSDAALYVQVTVTPEPSSVTSATAIPFVEDTATP